MDFVDGQTITVRGEGGAEFDTDVPKTGTTAREIFDEFIGKGWLTVVATPEGSPAAPPPDEPAPDEPSPDEPSPDEPPDEPLLRSVRAPRKSTG
jgi:hypothetical protein